MVGHCRWLLWEGYQAGYLTHPEAYSAFEKGLMYFLTLFKYGHQAVMVFFVLSGFVIHLRYSKLIKQEGMGAQFDFWAFFGRRLKRIYPAMLISIGVAYILYLVGTQLLLTTYTNNFPDKVVQLHLYGRYDWLTLVRNLLFLEKLNPYWDVWGNNGPLWSLALEWWFYMMYPILFYCTRRGIWLSCLVVVSAFAVSQYALQQDSTFFLFAVGKYLLVWWMGALLADTYTGRLNIPYWAWASGAILLPIAIDDNFITQNLVVGLPFIGVAYAGLLGAGLYWQQRGGRIPLPGWLNWLGKTSYSLYIIHMPVLVFLAGAVVKYAHQDKQMPPHFGWILPGVLISMLAGYLIYLVGEKPFLANHRR